MTSSNGNIFHVTGPLCGEFTGHRWIPHTKANDAERWCFLWSPPWINGWVNNLEAGDLRRRRAYYDVIVIHYKQTGKIPVVWNTITLMWCYCHVKFVIDVSLNSPNKICWPKSMPWLWLPRSLGLIGHQQPWHWLCRKWFIGFHWARH